MGGDLGGGGSAAAINCLEKIMFNSTWGNEIVQKLKTVSTKCTDRFLLFLELKFYFTSDSKPNASLLHHPLFSALTNKYHW